MRSESLASGASAEGLHQTVEWAVERLQQITSIVAMGLKISRPVGSARGVGTTRRHAEAAESLESAVDAVDDAVGEMLSILSRCVVNASPVPTLLASLTMHETAARAASVEEEAAAFGLIQSSSHFEKMVIFYEDVNTTVASAAIEEAKIGMMRLMRQSASRLLEAERKGWCAAGHSWRTLYDDVVSDVSTLMRVRSVGHNSDEENRLTIPQESHKDLHADVAGPL